MQGSQEVRSDAPVDIVNERYRLLERIGEGTYGTVYRAECRRTRMIVAIKKTRIDVEDEGVPATAIREMSVLRALKHVNVVDLIDIISQPKSLHLVFEYCNYDLKRYMSQRSLTPRDVKRFTYQILDGLAFLHSNRVLHRDLKPQNILVTEGGRLLKLADFGLARAFQIPMRTYTHEVVTLWYRPPEVLLGSKHYTPAMDVWAVGAIMVEMATRHPFAPGDSEIDQLFRIFRILGTPTEAQWPGVSQLKDYCSAFPVWQPKQLGARYPQIDPVGIDLLERMLVYDPARRITAADALRHPWFRDLGDPAQP